MNNSATFSYFILTLLVICPFFSAGQPYPYFGYCEVDLSFDDTKKEQLFKKINHGIESGIVPGLSESFNLITLTEMNAIIKENKIKSSESIDFKSIIVWDIDSNESNFFALKIIKSKEQSSLFSINGNFENILGKDLYLHLRQKTISNFLKKANNSEVNEMSSVLIEYERTHNSNHPYIPRPDSLASPDSLTYRFLPYSKYEQLYLGKIEDLELMIKEFFSNGILTIFKSEKLDNTLTFTEYESLKKSGNGKVSKMKNGIIITENWLQAQNPPASKETNTFQFNPLYPLLKKEVYSLGIIIDKHRFWIDFNKLKSYVTSESYKDYNNSKYTIQFKILDMIINSSFCEKINLQLDLS